MNINVKSHYEVIEMSRQRFCSGTMKKDYLGAFVPRKKYFVRFWFVVPFLVQSPGSTSQKKNNNNNYVSVCQMSVSMTLLLLFFDMFLGFFGGKGVHLNNIQRQKQCMFAQIIYPLHLFPVFSCRMSLSSALKRQPAAAGRSAVIRSSIPSAPDGVLMASRA